MCARTRMGVFARVCVHLRQCTRMWARVHVSCAHVRASARVCAGVRASTPECMRVRAVASVGARIAGMHACSPPWVHRLVDVCVRAFFCGCATIPDFRRLRKNKKKSLITP